MGVLGEGGTVIGMWKAVSVLLALQALGEQGITRFPHTISLPAAAGTPQITPHTADSLPDVSVYIQETGEWREGRWTMKVASVRVGRELVQTNWTEIRLESTQKAVYGPEDSIRSLHQFISRNRRCVPSTESLLCNCGPLQPPSLYPSISFHLSNSTVTLHPESYLQRTESNQCTVMLFPYEKTYWTFGLPFFKQYSALINPQSLSIGLLPRHIDRCDWVTISVAVSCIAVAVAVGKYYNRPSKVERLLEYDYLGLTIR